MFTFLLQTENLKQTEKQDWERQSRNLDFWEEEETVERIKQGWETENRNETTVNEWAWEMRDFVVKTKMTHNGRL